MGTHVIEETTYDESGKRKLKKKHAAAHTHHKAEKKIDEEQEQEEEHKGDSTKVKDKFKLPHVRVPTSCKVCDGPLVQGGPIWNRPIHDVTFVKRLFESVRLNVEGQNGHKVKTAPRIQAILTAIIDESPL